MGKGRSIEISFSELFVIIDDTRYVLDPELTLIDGGKKRGQHVYFQQKVSGWYGLQKEGIPLSRLIITPMNQARRVPEDLADNEEADTQPATVDDGGATITRGEDGVYRN